MRLTQCDLVLVEGYDHPSRLEVSRSSVQKLAPGAVRVEGVATDGRGAEPLRPHLTFDAVTEEVGDLLQGQGRRLFNSTLRRSR